MKRKVYIHIGIGKTGTSSIQKTLSTCSNELHKKSIFYPLACNHPSGAQHCLAHNGVKEMPEQVFDSFNSIISEFEVSKNHSLILSSENFSFCRENYIQKISEILKDYDVKIVFYVRKQKELIRSAFLQNIKAGILLDSSFDNFFEKSKNAWLYTGRIEYWNQFFGKENIVVRVYDDPKIKNNVCLDFNKIVGIDKTIEASTIRENASIIDEFSQLCVLINKNIDNKGLKQILMQEIIQISTQFKEYSKKPTLSDKNDNFIEEFYKHDNEVFASRFLDAEQKNIFLNNLHKGVAE